MDTVITYKKMKTVKILRLIGEKPIGKGSYGVVWKAVDDDFIYQKEILPILLKLNI